MPDPEVLRLRVPRDNNTWLLYPKRFVDSLVDANAVNCARFPNWILDLRGRARREAMQLSRDYLQELGGGLGSELDRLCSDQQSLNQDCVLFVGGHQPELFHPGVWFKNILLNQLSATFSRVTKRHSRSLHVIIDHDLARATSLRVPYTDDGELFQKQVKLPHTSSSSLLPWQNMILPDEQTDTVSSVELLQRWEQCIQRISLDCRALGVEPMIVERRAELLEHVRSSKNLGEAFTRFRQLVERSNGVGNHEVPMSRICNGQSFGEFVFYCIRHHRELHEIYNRCREVYRHERDIKNPAQPVPALQIEATSKVNSNESDWFEMPFWMYRDLGRGGRSKIDKVDESAGERTRLWCRSREDVYELTTSPMEPTQASTLRLTGNVNGKEWEDAWKSWMERGICIRPRALMTTLFLRYFVADLFVHGIGGGLYDALTDAIAGEFLKVEPMRMLIASASCHMPLKVLRSQIAQREEFLDISKLNDTRHRLRSAPESFLDVQNQEHAILLARHRAMIEQIPPRGARKAWYHSMLSLRQEIRTAVEWEHQRLKSLYSLYYANQNDIRIRQSREYSFALFPERHLVEQLGLLAKEAISSWDDVAIGK